MTTTYEKLKKVIEMNKKSSEEILYMMDVFAMAGKITTDEYLELYGMLA